jgi:hypothetical protein
MSHRQPLGAARQRPVRAVYEHRCRNEPCDTPPGRPIKPFDPEQRKDVSRPATTASVVTHASPAPARRLPYGAYCANGSHLRGLMRQQVPSTETAADGSRKTSADANGSKKLQFY